MIECVVCKKDADTLAGVLVSCDGDFACGEACAKKHEENKRRFFASVGSDAAYAGWWAEGGVDIKKHGEGAWRTEK